MKELRLDLMEWAEKNFDEFFLFVRQKIKDFETKSQSSPRKIKEIWIDKNHIQITFEAETYCFKTIEQHVAENSGNENDDY